MLTTAAQTENRRRYPLPLRPCCVHGDVTDPRNLTTRYDYDGLGNRLKLQSPDTGTTVYQHDAAGNITTRTDAKGQTTAYTYDALNRLTNIDHPGSQYDVSITYDTCSNGIGRRCQVNDASGTTTFGYDLSGNLTVRTNNTQGTVRYAYDAANRLTGITTPSGRSISYRYDALGRINQVSTTDATGATQTLASQMTYRPFGTLASLTYGNGLNLTQSFDTAERLITQQVQGAQAIQHLNLSYDATGNITDKANVLDPSRTQTFGYDALDRLIGAQGLYGNIAYSYDALGNRLTQTDATGTSTYLYEAQSNRLTSITDNTGTTPYSYDANGNPLTIGSDTYAYNPDNRLLQYQGATTASYVYNHQGLRTQKTTAQGSTQYVYDTRGHLIAEYGTNNNHKEYVYLNDEPLALIEDNNFYYIHNDHLATPQQITDQTQTVVWAADYKPFGEVTTTITAVENRIRFPGQYYDGESGLHYNYFRDYNPKVGRYNQADKLDIVGRTIDPQLVMLGFGDAGWFEFNGKTYYDNKSDYSVHLNHPYGYANQNPLYWYDSFGLDVNYWSGTARSNVRFGDTISLPNGNLWGGFTPQDGTCTLGPFSSIANNCFPERCLRHDQCYEDNKCNISSWIINLLGGTKSCNQCNSNF